MKTNKQVKAYVIRLMIECIQNELDGHEHPAWEDIPQEHWTAINKELTHRRDSLRKTLDELELQGYFSYERE